MQTIVEISILSDFPRIKTNGKINEKLHCRYMTILVLIKMLCACNGQSLEAGSIVDLDRVITEYAWRELKRDSRWYNCLRRQDFTVDVPWNFFEFDHKTVKFKTRSGPGESGYRERKQVELFNTDFTNSTNKDQVYKLRTQRQTKAATSVAIQKGFTLKGNTNFKLKIPTEIGHFGVSASTDGYLRVSRSRGETFEDTFTWQVDSDVTVEPKHVTDARLMVTEDELVADFEVRTSMRMPTGEAPIIVKRKSSKEIYAVLMISDLREVFHDIDCNILNISKAESQSKRPRYAIEFATTGILESVRWRNQKICLESHPIQARPEVEITPRAEASHATNTDELPIYSSAIFSKVLEHATKGDNTAQAAAKVTQEDVRYKKDLRFNIVPTVISETKEEIYESPEKLLSQISKETGFSMNILSQTLPDLGESKELPRQPQRHIRPDIAIESFNPPPQETSSKPYRPPDLKSRFNPTELHQRASPTQETEILPQILPPQPETPEVQYQQQRANVYYKPADATYLTYKPLIRDITQIEEEPEMERAANMSKQSSVQSEEANTEDTTESLDSGDSRRISKVTSV